MKNLKYEKINFSNSALAPTLDLFIETTSTLRTLACLLGASRINNYFEIHSAQSNNYMIVRLRAFCE